MRLCLRILGQEHGHTVNKRPRRVYLSTVLGNDNAAVLPLSTYHASHKVIALAKLSAAKATVGNAQHGRLTLLERHLVGRESYLSERSWVNVGIHLSKAQLSHYPVALNATNVSRTHLSAQVRVFRKVRGVVPVRRLPRNAHKGHIKRVYSERMRLVSNAVRGIRGKGKIPAARHITRRRKACRRSAVMLVVTTYRHAEGTVRKRKPRHVNIPRGYFVPTARSRNKPCLLLIRQTFYYYRIFFHFKTPLHPYIIFGHTAPHALYIILNIPIIS